MMMPSCMRNSRITYRRRCRCRSRVVVTPLAQVISPSIPQSRPYCRDSTHLQPICAIKSWRSSSDETLLWILNVAATNHANETWLLLSLLLQCLPGDLADHCEEKPATTKFLQQGRMTHSDKILLLIGKPNCMILQ